MSQHQPVHQAQSSLLQQEYGAHGPEEALQQLRQHVPQPTAPQPSEGAIYPNDIPNRPQQPPLNTREPSFVRVGVSQVQSSSPEAVLSTPQPSPAPPRLPTQVSGEEPPCQLPSIASSSSSMSHRLSASPSGPSMAPTLYEDPPPRRSSALVTVDLAGLALPALCPQLNERDKQPSPPQTSRVGHNSDELTPEGVLELAAEVTIPALLPALLPTAAVLTPVR